MVFIWQYIYSHISPLSTLNALNPLIPLNPIIPLILLILLIPLIPGCTLFGLEEQVQRHKFYSMEYTWMLNKSFECHEKVLFSCQRHFREKSKTMIMFLSEKHFDIPFRGSLIWMEWMNCWSDQDGNIHSTLFDFATYTKAVETMALFVEKECACFILNTDVDLQIIRFSLLDM